MTTQKPAPFSFVALMAVLMSFVALSIDAMLPALGQIGKDLGVQNPNDIQLVISSVFLGMGFGLIFFGPLSDSFGRKPAIYGGIAIFLVGCLASIFATTFETMIVGRCLQGMGAASCRTVTMAMIRDRFSGRTMAKTMSFIMIIFILVPALAPSLGQGIMLFASWRAIFVAMLILAIISALWLGLGQKETLALKDRRPFSKTVIWAGTLETLRNKTALGYTLASGLIFSAFVGYLSSSQQILQVQYKLGQSFALVFGCLALCIGLASFFNSRLVDRYPMETLCFTALSAAVGLAALYWPFAYYHGGHPPLISFIAYLGTTFFCFGILFGNFSTLALLPLGHIAGVANSVISSLQTLMSVALGGFVAYCYNGTVIPLISGFLVFGISSLFLIRRLKNESQKV